MTQLVRDAPRSRSDVAAHGIRGVLTLETVWVAVGVFLPAILSMAGTFPTIDLSYHLRVGEHLLRTGEILQTDTFTFTAAGRPWLNQQWGAQALFALLFRVGGFATLAFARAVVMAAIAWLLFLACRARGASRRSAAVLTAVALCLSLPTLAVRPQLFGLVLFALALWILVTRVEHPRRLWLLPLDAVIWANVHGSFVFLPVILALTLVDSRARRLGDDGRLLLVGGISLVATLANPYGIGVWTYVVALTTNPIVQTWITEWRPLTIRDPYGIVVLSSALLIVGYLARRARPAAWVDLLWLLAFFLAALAAARSLVWWAFVAPVVIAGTLPRRRPERADHPGSPRLNAAILASLAIVALLLLPWYRDVRLISAPQGLVRSVAAATQPGDRVFVVQQYGAWFEFALPDRPVFVDSRIEIFPEATWLQYGAIASGRADWESILDRWRVEGVVTEEDTPLVRFLRVAEGWRLVDRDEDGFVFVRDRGT
jgi:hypothetical protein